MCSNVVEHASLVCVLCQPVYLDPFSHPYTFSTISFLLIHRLQVLNTCMMHAMHDIRRNHSPHACTHVYILLLLLIVHTKKFHLAVQPLIGAMAAGVHVVYVCVQCVLILK